MLGAMFTLVASDVFWIVPVADHRRARVRRSACTAASSARRASACRRARSAKCKTLVQQLAVGFAIAPLDRRRRHVAVEGLLWVAVVLARDQCGLQYLCTARAEPPSRASPHGVLTARRATIGAMRCDVVAVGTELLLGQIVDTNSSWIGEQLAAERHRLAAAGQGRRQPRPHRGRAAPRCSRTPTR